MEVFVVRRRRGDGEVCYAINKLVLTLSLRYPTIGRLLREEDPSINNMKSEWKKNETEEKKQLKKKEGYGFYVGGGRMPFG